MREERRMCVKKCCVQEERTGKEEEEQEQANTVIGFSGSSFLIRQFFFRTNAQHGHQHLRYYRNHNHNYNYNHIHNYNYNNNNNHNHIHFLPIIYYSYSLFPFLLFFSPLVVIKRERETLAVTSTTVLLVVHSLNLPNIPPLCTYFDSMILNRFPQFLRLIRQNNAISKKAQAIKNFLQITNYYYSQSSTNWTHYALNLNEQGP